MFQLPYHGCNHIFPADKSLISSVSHGLCGKIYFFHRMDSLQNDTYCKTFLWCHVTLHWQFRLYICLLVSVIFNTIQSNIIPRCEYRSSYWPNDIERYREIRSESEVLHIWSCDLSQSRNFASLNEGMDRSSQYHYIANMSYGTRSYIRPERISDKYILIAFSLLPEYTAVGYSW